MQHRRKVGQINILAAVSRNRGCKASSYPIRRVVFLYYHRVRAPKKQFLMYLRFMTSRN